MYVEDTIAAISTSLGEGGIGIVRVSGPEAESIGDSLLRIKKSGGFDSHRFYYGNAVDPATDALLDEVFAVFMRRPRSYTREDVLEIHCHGGSLVVRRILDAVLRAGARLADPGEFTRRAFLNGRVDLVQAESVIEIIRSKTDRGLALAQNRRSGLLSLKISVVREHLLQALALLEAYVDFPEEEVDGLSLDQICSHVRAAARQLAELLSSFDVGKILRDGVSVVIAGKPNVGKSSLLNSLLQEQRAIVTAIPGTTRDVIEEMVSIEGIPVRLSDTAGLRVTDDEVERIGVELTRDRLRDADLVLFLVDGSCPLEEADLDIYRSIETLPHLVVVTKHDLPPRFNWTHDGDRIVHISSVTHVGIAELKVAIADAFLSGHAHDSRELCALADARQRDALQSASDAVDAFLSGFQQHAFFDLLATDLREALHRIGLVTGETTPDDILDLIFGKFCIGK